MERFFNKIIKTKSCWNWVAALRGNGYGAFKYEGKTVSAHRMSWMIHNGDIPDNRFVCHTCDNRKCVNPDHLFLGTQKDNMRDCVNKNRFVFSIGKRFKNGDIPNNRILKSDTEINFVKEKIKNRTVTLKELSIDLSLPLHLLRDISCGRIY
jgi:hypothetical protein